MILFSSLLELANGRCQAAGSVRVDRLQPIPRQFSHLQFDGCDTLDFSVPAGGSCPLKYPGMRAAGSDAGGGFIRLSYQVFNGAFKV